MAEPPDEIKHLKEQFQRSAEEVHQLLEQVTEEQLSLPPAPGKWSMGECIEHLNRTGTFITEEMELSISEGIRKNLKGKPPYHYGWFNRFFIRMMEPGSRMKTPAPGMYKPDPAAVYKKENLLKAYSQLQDHYCELLDKAEGLDLKRVKVRSPVLRILRLSLGACFHAMAAHQDRHVAQARHTQKGVEK